MCICCDSNEFCNENGIVKLNNLNGINVTIINVPFIKCVGCNYVTMSKETSLTIKDIENTVEEFNIKVDITVDFKNYK